MRFEDMDVSTIASGVTTDGVRYLQLFLAEYTSIFSETVNPSCNKCLSNYLSKYKRYVMSKSNQNTSGYVLHAKYENIPLEFGSPILVNNTNITEEYAQTLLSQDEGERYFSTIPDGSEAKPKAPAKTKAPAKPKATKAKAPKEPKPAAEKEIEPLIKAEDINVNDAVIE
jgi:hypothetical protein